jgi:purine-nucleoside phosphorylase
MNTALRAKVAEAAAVIRRRRDGETRFGIILGTGSQAIAGRMETEQSIPYAEIPGLPQSTATGHKGAWVLGRLAGQKVMAMQGRFHLYEGYPVELATLPIHLMSQLGVEVLFITNASGGINPKFAGGEIMAIESHFDLMFYRSPSLGPDTVFDRPVSRSDQYDRELIEWARECGRKRDFPVHQGVYAGMLGPNFETRAEYRFLKKVGADVAGMSTVPEVTVASRLGMRILGLSVIANVAKPDVLEPTSGEEVIDAAAVAAPNLLAVVEDAIERLSQG